MTNLAALDLNLLVALESLLQEVSVGRAAHRVALSQPAMSHALKRLRSLLAIRCWYVSGRKCNLPSAVRLCATLLRKCSRASATS